MIPPESGHGGIRSGGYLCEAKTADANTYSPLQVTVIVEDKAVLKTATARLYGINLKRAIFV